jgi:hypothetical protein
MVKMPALTRLPQIILRIRDAISATAARAVVRMVRVARVLVERVALRSTTLMLSVWLRLLLATILLLLVAARPFAALLGLFMLLLLYFL